MFSDIASVTLTLLPVLVNTSILYLFITLFLGFLSPRQIAELTIIELVVIAALGSSVETAMVAGNKSLVAGLISAGTLLLCNRFLSFLIHHSMRLQRLVVGCPIPLIYKGKFLRAKIRRAGLTEEDVLEGIRERGYEKVEDIYLAFREIDGSISALAKTPHNGNNGRRRDRS